MRVKLITIFSATIIIFSIMVPFSVFGETPLFEEPELPREPLIPSRIERAGTYFEIQDSEYLDITLGSAEEIRVVLELIPGMISLDVETATENINSTELIIEGLEPNKTYYKYQDSYKNEAVFISSENGDYSWLQGLSQPHHVWIQEIKGTTFIDQDTILDSDITGSVEIIANNIVLDCNGHSITGSGIGYGIYLNSRENVTIKDCTVINFSYGIYLYNRSTNNEIIGNNVLDNDYGISIQYSPENYLRNNSITNNKYNFSVKGGIWALGALEYTQDVDTSNTVDGKPIYYLVNEENVVIDSATNAGYVGVVSSKNIIVKGLILERNAQGILLAYTTESAIEDVNISDNQYGVFLYNSSNNEITENNILNNYRYGICLDHLSSNNNISENNISDNEWGGIIIEDSSNNNIIKNDVLNSDDGIVIGSGWYYASSYNTISENNVSGNRSLGIYLGSSENNTVIKNTVLNGEQEGIYLNDSSNNNITENYISNNEGIGLYISGWRDRQSKKNKIIGNDVSNNEYGIYLAYSAPENYFRDNSLVNNKYNFTIYGYYAYYGYYQASHYIQDIDTSNTINGKPIYYLVSEQDRVIDADSNAGFIGAINSKNIRVKNVTLENNYEGVLFFNTANSIIESVNVLDNKTGIGLHSSTGIDIIGNNAVGNNRGIYLSHSSSNNITANTISDNIDTGVVLFRSTDNNINGNTILNNRQYGIHLSGEWNAGSTNNNIYHNNFIDNSRQVRFHYATNNLFDTGYPDGGNYWSDYIGVDFYNGPEQDQVGSDRIGDFPYTFIGGRDNYPFMEESGWEVPDLVFQPNKDGFGFQNFCPTYFDEKTGKEVTRTWDMFVQFFGKEATMIGEDTRRFTAEHFFEEEYAKYNSDSCGSCDGFSGVSLINFEQLEQPNSGIFDMPFYSQLYPQSINDNIKKAIAYQQGFHFGYEAITYFKNLEQQSFRSPKFFYGKIKQAVDNKESIVVWIFDVPNDGHALVPYKYREESSENKAYVYVYDSNYPGDNDRIIEFDLKNDEWTYKLKKGWWIFGETWRGNSFTPELSIATIPLDVRLNKGVPPWGQDISPYAYICSVGQATAPLFTNQSAQKIGFVNEEFVNEIPEALYFIGPTQNQDKNSGLYYLPQEDDYTINFYGMNEGELNFSVYGNQSLIELTGANVNPTTIDNINIGGGNSSLTYSTNDDYKEYSVVITKEFSDASSMIKMDTEILAGDITTIEMTDEQSFKYMNTGDSKSYDLILEQRGEGAGQISFSDLIVGANNTHIVEVINWNDLENTAINAKIDEGSDGTIDKIERLQVIPRWLKKEVKTNLETAKTGHKLIDREIDLIIKQVNKSLDDKLWVDDFHLDPKNGKKVFHKEHVAVTYMYHRIELFEKKIKILEKLIEKKQKRGSDITKEESQLKAIKSILPVFKQAVYDLAKADEKLAEVVIDDAKNTLVKNPKFQKIVNRQIKKVEKELSKAKKELAKSQVAKAITRFGKAWFHAQLAIKFAKLNS